MTVLRLGTRRSPLALAQSGVVARALEARHADLEVQLVPIVTRGDREPGELAAVGGKGLFTEELEDRLRDGRLDLAVHSLKDLPVRLGDGLAIAAFPERADPRDALIADLDGTDGGVLEALPRGASVLTGSLRRAGQLRAQRPDLEVRPVRGNVETRLARWRDGGHGGVLLAMAGLDRLGLLATVPAHPLATEVMVPAPGQGTLALETRVDGAAAARVAALDHPATARTARAERRVVAALGGDCTLPLGVFAHDAPNARMLVRAVLVAPDGSRRAEGVGLGDGPENAAEACLEALRADGAEALLAMLA